MMTGTLQNKQVIELIGSTRLIISFMANLMAGIALYYGLPFFETNPNRFVIILLFTLLTFSLTLLFIIYARLQKFISKGVVKVLDSMTDGEGSTEAIISRVYDEFSFMGIGARKWISTGNSFRDMIKRVGARTNEIRILLLDPNSPEAKRIARSIDMEEEELKEMINDSLKFFQRMNDQGMNVSVKLYAFMPIFRIAIVDNGLIYLGFYRGRATGNDTPQLVLNASRESFFKPFKEYFEVIWNDETTVHCI
jgi:hypothetical protein